ncbi:hypothetical protein ALQ04_03457 [Pseudomonas cichorii]|uniref:Uncharacterized protein n=1 Tax=Pseudomonas cichorii TaxID=36746 RepID=A0A3M4M8M5_PSECI|nr:hypothetical protein [Pseudomonas cichorii]RMQ49511.1 hypothetical protein ALQ04_03457 [Pseudomonas cichorii]
MTVTKAMTDKESRAAYRRLLRSFARTLPAQPNMGAENPLLADTADDAVNQLPLAFQGKNLVVEVPAFTVAEPPDFDGSVKLLWRGSPVGTAVVIKFPLDPSIFPLKLTLPAAQTIVAGTYELKYRVFTGNSEESSPLLVSIDTMAPNAGSPGKQIELPAEVESGGITKEYLDANGSVLLTIPDYGDAKINDEITVYFGSTLPGIKVGTIVRADLSTPTTLELTAAQVGTQEGAMFIGYTLMDRVGNIGQPSYKTVEVVLKPAPANLQPPTVPQDADTDRITLQDAYDGVGVFIEQYDNFTAGDQVRVIWEGAPQPLIAIAEFPAVVTLGYAALKGSSDGPKTVHVTYEIVRGNRTYPEPTGVDVEVDLRKPGPPNPDPDPGDINPDLALVTVQARVTTSPNKIAVADAGEDADASVELYKQSKADDVMQLYWKGVAVPGGVYNVTGSEAADFVVDFVIPWASIEAGGNDPALPVHYTIAHPSVNANVDTSGPQPVEVLVLEHKIPVPAFQHLFDGATDWINCDSLRLITGQGWNAEVLIPGGEPQLAGQELSFKYIGWADNGGTTAIPNNEHDFKYTPSLQETVDGFIVLVPYAPLLETYNRWGSIEYSAVIDGFPATSGRHLVRVFMQLTGNASCRFDQVP